MDNNDFMSRITSDETHKTALLFAFYNSVIFTMIGLCLIGVFAIYQVLFMFLMPILWAILIGTVIFPFKRHIGTSLKGWLDRLNEENRPLMIGIALLPIEIIRKISETVYETALSSTGFYCCIGYIVLKILCFDDIFLRILSWLGVLYSILDFCIEFTTQRLILTFIVLYSVGYVTWICLQERVHKKFARFLSLPIWICVLSFIADFFGPLRVPIFSAIIFAFLLIGIGVINVQEVKIDEGSPNEDFRAEDEGATQADKIAAAMTKEVDNEIRQPNSATIVNKNTLNDIGRKIEEDADRLDHALSSDLHFRIIGGLCLLLWMVHHDILLIFILIPMLIAIFIRIGEHIGVFDVLHHIADVFWSKVGNTVQKVVNVVVAGPLRKFIRLLFSSDKMFITGLTSRVDFIASVTVMASIALGSLFFVFFTVFQMHNETVHLVRLGSNLVQSNPDWMKYAINYTEGHLADHDFGEYIDQAYQHGRKWLASNVRSLADPADSERADQLENQIIELVDSIYQMWTERNSEINATTAAVRSDYEAAHSPYDWMTQIMSTPNLQSLRRELTSAVSDNIETVLAIMQSLWTVVLLNVTLLKTMLGAVLGIVFGFGFELFNLIIEVIVFLTVVYYLLASSDEQWLPLRLINEFAPTGEMVGNSNLDIARAFADAINGVFVLSTKMSIFYGLYTYFVHSLFELNIVFLPSMLAAVFAVIPIMPPYIVAFIGFVEIFFVRGDTAAGIIFALTSIAPLFFADAAFYREIKNTHPYVTGLAVIGGMYWLGLQGAIFGPIILCCVVTLFNLYKEFAKSH